MSYYLYHETLLGGIVLPVHQIKLRDNMALDKRALGPWVAHLRMTDQWSGTICEILVECIIRNNSVKLY